jgi:hypothetical protein
MKPVVSSLVALVISLAPLSAMAKEPKHHAKTAHVQKKDEKAASLDKGEKAEKSSEKSPMIRVKAGKKDGVGKAVHHAKDVDIASVGHHEPKVDKNGAIVPASMTTKIDQKAEKKHEIKADKKAKPAPAKDLPKLPAAKKGGNEKGAKKPAPKSEPAPSSADDGEATRDEELAELVARIRGVHSEAPAKSAKTDEPSKSEKPEVKPEGGNAEKGEEPIPAAKPDGKKAKNVSHVTPASGHGPATPAVRCVKEPVEIVRGPEVERFELTKCDGSIAPAALERFSVLIRPGGAARPVAPPAELAKKAGNDLAPGIRRVSPGLLERVQQVADHFGKPGSPARFFVISGYRPASIGSMHSSGRAMDFRVDGAKNEDVVAFCKTLGDTGCGFYPNSSFVHMDVRDAGTGHTAWIDASGPGETPRYVKEWPEQPADSSPEKGKGLKRASATEPVTPGIAPEVEGLAEEGEDLLKAKRPSEDDDTLKP